MTRCPPRLAVALLERFVPDNDPLTGDLLEEWCGRTNAWLWRQVLLAICTLAMVSIRTNPRARVEAILVAVGVLALLGFCAMVAASLLNQVLGLSDVQWLSALERYRYWPFLLWAVSFAAAVLIGRTVSRFHCHHRIAAILACGVSATIAAFANLVLFVPSMPNQPFFPHAVTQMTVAMLFISGLFAGILSRSTCEPLSSS